MDLTRSLSTPPVYLFSLCKDVILHLLGHDFLGQGLQFAGEELDGPFPHDVLSLQDLREEASEST